MTRQRPFIQCNVFSTSPLKGNGLAVVNDADDLSKEQMQAFAGWTNLAETAFIMKPKSPLADYGVRIFTPNAELPFAGHPTLGSCSAWLHWKGKPKADKKVVQECEIGLIDIHKLVSRKAFLAPPTKIIKMPKDQVKALCENLSISEKKVINAIILENGPTFHVLELTDAHSVLTLKAVKSDEHFGFVGLLGKYLDNLEADYEVRMLDMTANFNEDPITGSLNAALAKWLFSERRLWKNIVISQGQNIGREGRVYIDLLNYGTNKILVGGNTQIVIEGSVEL